MSASVESRIRLGFGLALLGVGITALVSFVGASRQLGQRGAPAGTGPREKLAVAVSGALVALPVVGLGLWVIERDRRRRRAAEAALEESQARLERAEERIAALSEKLMRHARDLEAARQELEAFSYSVSHDLRAPLRHIAGFADLLRQSASGLDDAGRRYLDKVSQAAARMGTLLDDLLGFSRVGSADLNRAPVPLSPLVGAVVAELEREAADRAIRWRIEPLPTVEGDPALLRMAFVNLISNALKYTRTRSEARIEIGSEDREGEAVLYVRDNGVGFDPQYAHKLFGVFQRLHRPDEFEGNGMGLANVRRIVHRHGGRTWAEGHAGQGATFYLSLPDAMKEAA